MNLPPEILFAGGCVITGVSYFVGYYVAVGHCWKRSANREAELRAECDRLRRRVDELSGTETMTFSGNLGDPAALASAYNIMEKRRMRPPPLP
jgi:hypothetical protein